MANFKRMIDKIKLMLASKNGIITYYRKRGAIIGSDCDINKSLNIIAEPYLVQIGNNVRITSGVKLITHYGGLYVPRHMPEMKKLCEKIDKVDIFGRIKIGNNVHIGVDAIIMPGVSIGNNVIIGAGAVVVHDVPDNSVAVGVPAKVIKSIEQYVADNEVDFLYINGLSYEDKRRTIEQSNL